MPGRSPTLDFLIWSFGDYGVESDILHLRVRRVAGPATRM